MSADSIDTSSRIRTLVLIQLLAAFAELRTCGEPPKTW